MCGYCTETIVFDVIESENAGKKPVPDLNGGASQYLQASGDIVEALECCLKASAAKKVVPMTMVDEEVVICRAIEILLDEGFQTPGYRRLLRNHLFKRVITDACKAERRPHGELPCPAAADLLDILYDSATFTTEDGALRLKNLHLYKQQSQELLRWYIGWWLEGGTVRREDFTVESSEFTLFRSVFRAVFFSLTFLGRYRAAKPFLFKLICTRPSCIPYFDGLDLWLQRQAALRAFDHFKMEPFLSNLEEIRASLLFYIDLRRGISKAQKQKISQVLLTRPQADRTDDYFSLSEWLAEPLMTQ